MTVLNVWIAHVFKRRETPPACYRNSVRDRTLDSSAFDSQGEDLNYAILSRIIIGWQHLASDRGPASVPTKHTLGLLFECPLLTERQSPRSANVRALTLSSRRTTSRI